VEAKISEEKAKELLIKRYVKRQVMSMTVGELLTSTENMMVDNYRTYTENIMVDNYRTYLTFDEVRFVVKKEHPDLLGSQED
jgi:hypothetical protein